MRAAVLILFLAAALRAGVVSRELRDGKLTIKMDDGSAERGRGLLIAERLADEFNIVSDEHHTLVHFERRIATPAPAPATPLR